ncbi:MAG TPA: hypothetical protein VIJ25_11210 [Methylococcales bacterium]
MNEHLHISAEISLPQPRVVYGNDTADKLAVDPEVVGRTMQELGSSPEAIENTTIYTDSVNRLTTRGMTYPSWLGRLRHITNPDIRDSKGLIVRLSSVVGGKERDEESMDHTLVHELEHVAQMERGDRRLVVGHLGTLGLAAVGVIVGSRLGRGRVSKIGLALLGGLIGQQVGYQIAPHERQARSTADRVSTSAVTRRK